MCVYMDFRLEEAFTHRHISNQPHVDRLGKAVLCCCHLMKRRYLETAFGAKVMSLLFQFFFLEPIQFFGRLLQHMSIVQGRGGE